MKADRNRRYDFREVVSENLKSLMLHHEHLTSQSEIARKSGIPQRTVGRIVHGEVQANLSSLVGLATAFGIEPWQLLVPGLNPRNMPRLHFLTEEQAVALQAISKAIAEVPGLGDMGSDTARPRGHA